MTQEEKDILLKDLCARLPYGVMVLEDLDKEFDGGYVSKLATVTEIKGENMFLTKNTLTPVTIEEVRPYLRPMSSMTEVEKEQYDVVVDFCDDTYCPDVVDWLLANHFDFRELIPKGLALEASIDMYK